MTNKKICAKCKESLGHDQFHKDGKAPDGLRYVCKHCLSHATESKVAMRERDAFNILVSWPTPLQLRDTRCQ